MFVCVCVCLCKSTGGAHTHTHKWPTCRTCQSSDVCKVASIVRAGACTRKYICVYVSMEDVYMYCACAQFVHVFLVCTYVFTLCVCVRLCWLRACWVMGEYHYLCPGPFDESFWFRKRSHKGHATRNAFINSLPRTTRLSGVFGEVPSALRAHGQISENAFLRKKKV